MRGKRAVLPSRRAGVYRASDGKRWDAYVLDKDLILLGTYASIRLAAIQIGMLVKRIGASPNAYLNLSRHRPCVLGFIQTLSSRATDARKIF